MAKRSWRAIFIAEQKKLPKSATFQERGEATRRAAAIYHGRAVPETRSNPSGFRLVKLALMAAGAYTAYGWAKAQGWIK